MSNAAFDQTTVHRRTVPLHDLTPGLEKILKAGSRLGTLTARRAESGGLNLCTLVLDPAVGSMELWETPLGDSREFPSLTSRIPQAHWFERAVHDMFGVLPVGHPRFKSLIFHEAWPAGFHPLATEGPVPPGRSEEPGEYRFLTVGGEGVFEIPVGPIHAGIIEPGHFRFSCLGEIIHNLEIRLGYQHRGVEEQLTRIPWRHARFLAEAASSDTTVGNAIAHAQALEQILEIKTPPEAIQLRGFALEIERVACHLSDLGGICSDIGFAAGSAIFGRLRGVALGKGERLTDSRFLTAYVRPGGVRRPLPPDERDALLIQVNALESEYARAEPLLLDNPGALERMEGTGRVRPFLARDFGLSGPAGRASAVVYDVRKAFKQEPFASAEWEPAAESEGDVNSRVRIRASEVRTSLKMLVDLLAAVPEENKTLSPLPDALPPERVGVGIVEAWRGELIHLVFTDSAGGISRYHIKDPSFNNWTGLAIAARGELVSDFPLCNKSFGLSYSGNDL